MPNAFDGQVLHQIAQVVRDVQGGKRTLAPGIDKQLRERCWEMTNGKTRQAYVATLSEDALKSSAFSDWMAVENYGKSFKR
jgi:hypothetical protein